MILNEYHNLVKEFRFKVGKAVRRLWEDPTKLELTKHLTVKLREIIGLPADAPIPMEAICHFPKAVEPQDQQDAKKNELFVMVTLSIPKMVDGKLSMERANSVDIKIVTKVCKDKLILISCIVLDDFKKDRAGYFRRKNAQRSKSGVTLDSVLPTFVRTKNIPAFPKQSISDGLEVMAQNDKESTQDVR